MSLGDFMVNNYLTRSAAILSAVVGALAAAPSVHAQTQASTQPITVAQVQPALRGPVKLAQNSPAPIVLQPNARVNPPVKPLRQNIVPASIPQLQPLANIADAAFDAGVLLKLNLNDDLQGNVTGGLRQNYENAGTYNLGADVNLQKLIHDPGAQLHVMFSQSYGRSLQRDIGNTIKTMGWYYPNEQIQLSQLTYEQSFFNDKLNILGGRMNATMPFARPTYGCSFVSGAQCPNYLPLSTGGFSGQPYVTSGGRLRYEPTKKTYFQFGAFEVDPSRKSQEGFDWSLNRSTGYVMPVEIGYGTDFSNDRYPRHYKFGGWYNSAPFSDPYYNTKHQSRGLFGGSPLTDQPGRGGLYALGDQVVYRPEPGSLRNLAVFASVSGPLDGRETFRTQANAGFIYTGPFQSRSHDTLGVQITYLKFSDAETDYMNDLMVKRKVSSRLSSNEVMTELNYAVCITRGVLIIPNFQYLINPDITQRLDVKKTPGDAAIFGVRLSITMGDVLGLPATLGLGRH